MTKYCKKVLKLLNKLYAKDEIPHTTMDIIKHFPQKKQGKIALVLDDVLIELNNLGYLDYICADDTFFNIKISCKGISYVENSLKEWIFRNLIAILALIVSIIALFK